MFLYLGSCKVLSYRKYDLAGREMRGPGWNLPLDPGTGLRLLMQVTVTFKVTVTSVVRLVEMRAVQKSSFHPDIFIPPRGE